MWVSNADGAARLRLTGQGDTITSMAYEPLTGRPAPAAAARGGARRATGSRRAGTPNIPDGVYHLLDQFRAGRTGDLLVIAREGFDFRRRFEVPEHRAGHGSLVRSHMQTPVWSSEPLPAEPIRTVDLFPGDAGLARAWRRRRGSMARRSGGRGSWSGGWAKALANEAQGARIRPQ